MHQPNVGGRLFIYKNGILSIKIEQITFLTMFGTGRSVKMGKNKEK